MTFKKFEHQARLYVMTTLDEQELEEFRRAREEFGERAEELIRHYRELSAAIALSLKPHPPYPETKERLLARIREGLQKRIEDSRG